MLESLTGKSLVCRNTYEHLYKHFHTEGHKGFLNEASVTFIDKTDGKDPKKRERYWMQTLKTMELYGLNIADSV